MRPSIAFAAGWILFLAGCADHSLTTTPMPAERDPGFRLSAEQRGTLRSGVAAETLERLLARLPEEERDSVLELFQRGTRHAGIVASANPELQSLLDDVWKDRAVGPPEGLSHALPTVGGLGVTLVLQRELDAPGAGAIVLRRPPPAGDVIVLGEESATAAQLFRTVGVLMESRFRDGYPASQDMRIVVEKATVPADAPNAHATERMIDAEFGGTIERLRVASRQVLPDLGRVRALRL